MQDCSEIGLGAALAMGRLSTWRKIIAVESEIDRVRVCRIVWGHLASHIRKTVKIIALHLLQRRLQKKEF